MQVRIFKLVGGAELIAELVRTGDDGIVIRRPLQVHVIKGQNGEGHLAFAQWSMVATDDEVVLNPWALVAQPMTAIDEVARSYVEQTSGIALPTASGTLLQG